MRDVKLYCICIWSYILKHLTGTLKASLKSFWWAKMIERETHLAKNTLQLMYVSLCMIMSGHSPRFACFLHWLLSVCRWVKLGILLLKWLSFEHTSMSFVLRYAFNYIDRTWTIGQYHFDWPFWVSTGII